jgi:hypothetical protein
VRVSIFSPFSSKFFYAWAPWHRRIPERRKLNLARRGNPPYVHFSFLPTPEVYLLLLHMPTFARKRPLVLSIAVLVANSLRLSSLWHLFLPRHQT